MGKFDGILLASDLDGTLLKKDKSISAENLCAIDYFMKEGGYFTVITGRMPYALSRILDIVNVNAPIGCGNGGFVYDVKNQCILWSVCLEKAVLEPVRYVKEKYSNIGIEINTNKEILVVSPNNSVLTHLKNENLPFKQTDLDSFEGDISKILFADTPDNLDILINDLSNGKFTEKFQFIRSDINYYEILPQGIGKGKLLSKIAEFLNVSPEKTIAVGDNDNDISMFEEAGVGIAVANASAAAKASSDVVTVSNEESAISQIIKDIEHGKIKF